ncbi:MAG: ABC transporter ATP-binding protein [Lachnospiraceae bacterium]|nr:ABC transporter ATP-binding protein [Lachnospiraceae bacterium]
MDDIYIIDNITKRYSGKPILRGISMECRAGECLGIAGTNGIGKSTLLRILSGAERPDSGELRCLGRDLLRNRSYFSRLIAYVPQDNPLLEELTAADNLKLWSGKSMTGSEEEIRSLHIDEIINVRVSKMSGGMKRRLSIACALTGGSPVLIMDEPTAALDLYQRNIIYDYIRDYIGKGGMAIISTHDTQEMELADHLYLLHGGCATVSSPEEASYNIKAGWWIKDLFFS